MNAGVQIGYIGDRRIGLRSLIDPQFLQVERQPNRMEIKFFNADGIPFEPGVHLSLDSPTQGFVDKISEDKNSYQDNGEDSAAPNNQPATHINFVARKMAISRLACSFCGTRTNLFGSSAIHIGEKRTLKGLSRLRHQDPTVVRTFQTAVRESQMLFVCDLAINARTQTHHQSVYCWNIICCTILRLFQRKKTQGGILWNE